jgi:hypothetical protein
MTLQIPLSQFDENFIEIFESIVQTINDGVSSAVRRVFESSHAVLDESSRKALSDFYSLYYDKSAHDMSTSVNKSVDDLFELAQSHINSIGSLRVDDLKEDPHLEEQRLSLSAVQKQLETLLTLDSRVRERLLPALMSMQIEDMIKQFTQRLTMMLKIICAALPANFPLDAESTMQLQTLAVSQPELKQFYKSILKQTPPEYLEQTPTAASTWS